MKRIKNYLLTTIIVFAPALLLAHPGHEHHGTGMELFFHYLVTIVLVLAMGIGAYYLIRKKSPARNKHS
jgi:hypothetical protein